MWDLSAICLPSRFVPNVSTIDVYHTNGFMYVSHFVKLGLDHLCVSSGIVEFLTSSVWKALVKTSWGSSIPWSLRPHLHFPWVLG